MASHVPHPFEFLTTFDNKIVIHKLTGTTRMNERLYNRDLCLFARDLMVDGVSINTEGGEMHCNSWRDVVRATTEE